MDRYQGVALGVECAWPAAAVPAFPGLPAAASDPVPSSSPLIGVRRREAVFFARAEHD